LLALVACIAWLVGVEGLPALHLAHHDDHHTHDASGTVIDHGDHAHADVADHDRDGSQLAIDHPVTPGHDAAGLAHHAVALHASVPPVIAPVTRAQTRCDFALAPRQHRAASATPAARGPPGSRAVVVV
jgi:hypothetical protein